MSDVRSLRRHCALLEGFPVEFLDAEGHWVPDRTPAPPDAFSDRRSPDQLTVGQWEDQFTQCCGAALQPLVLKIDAPAGRRNRLGTIRRRDPYLWERSLGDGPFEVPADPVSLLVGDRGRLDRDGPGAEGVLRIRLPWGRPVATVLVDEPITDPQLETYGAVPTSNWTPGGFGSPTRGARSAARRPPSGSRSQSSATICSRRSSSA